MARKPKNALLKARIDKDMKRRLEILAEKREWPEAEIVREAMRFYLAARVHLGLQDHEGLQFDPFIKLVGMEDTSAKALVLNEPKHPKRSNSHEGHG